MTVPVPHITVEHPDAIYDNYDKPVSCGGDYDFETHVIRLGCVNGDIDESIDTLIHEHLHHELLLLVGEEASNAIDNTWCDYHNVDAWFEGWWH